MNTYDSLEALFLGLNKNIENAMKHEVSDVVKKVESEKVESEVYDRYKPSTSDGEPWRYERRKTNGGLADTTNMIPKTNIVANGVELTVENITEGSQDSFKISDLIEGGDGTNGKQYQYKTNRDGTADQYLRARPFQRKTEEELAKTGDHEKALKVGLRRNGLDVL
jgi:hypothetical protein